MRFIVGWALLIILAPVTHAQEYHPQAHHPQSAVPSVTVTGEGLVAVEPDLAEIEIGVVTEAKAAPQAAKDNAAKLAKVIAEVKKLLGSGDEIKTIGYSLSPNYRYPKEGGKPELTGYTATNVVRVKTGGLDGVGKLIDVATQAGANNIQRLVFTLKNEDAAKREALRIATTKAKSKAEEIARALGLKVVRVLSVTEGEQIFRPMVRARGEMQAQAAQTPVESGTIEVRATVTLTAEVGGQ